MPASKIPEPWASAMEKANIGDPRSGRPGYRSLAHASGVAIDTLRLMVLGQRVPKQENVQAVADALRVDVRTVSEWIGQSRAVKQPYEPPDEAHLLDLNERRAVNEVIRLLAASKKHTAQPTPVRQLRAADKRPQRATRSQRSTRK